MHSVFNDLAVPVAKVRSPWRSLESVQIRVGVIFSNGFHTTRHFLPADYADLRRLFWGDSEVFCNFQGNAEISLWFLRAREFQGEFLLQAQIN